MSPVSDPDAKRWLADDENFIATLGDLDRGLADSKDSGDPPANAKSPSAASSTGSAAPAPSPDQTAPRSPEARLDSEPPPRRETTARSGAASPLSTAFLRPAAGDPNAPRRLLNLFPESALEPERPPDSSSGSGPSTTSEDRTAARARATLELLAAIRARGGPALLIAPAGWGKTTLCRTLPKELDRRTVVSLVSDPPQSLDDLIRRMLVDFGVMPPDPGETANVARPVLINALNAFLQSLEQLNAGAVVVLDDAHHIPVEVFVDLAALLAPGTPGARVLQLVLAGEPPLAPLLKHPELRDFDARIGQRTQFGDPGAEPDERRRPEPAAVTREERPRLSPPAVGPANDDVDIADLFDESVELQTAKPLHGPAVTSAWRTSTAISDPPAFEPAADPAPDSDDRPRGVRRLLIVAALALLVLAGAGGGLWVWRDAVARMIVQWESIPSAPAAPALLVPAPIAPVPPPVGIASSLPKKPVI